MSESQKEQWSGLIGSRTQLMIPSFFIKKKAPMKTETIWVFGEGSISEKIWLILVAMRPMCMFKCNKKHNVHFNVKSVSVQARNYINF